MRVRYMFFCMLLIFLFLPAHAIVANAAQKPVEPDTWKIAAEKKPPKDEPTPIPPPNIFEFHMNNGYIYLKKKDYKNSIEEFEQAIVINAEYYKPYRGLGDVYRTQGNLKRALEYYKKAIELINPTYFKTKLKQAEEFEQKGNLTKAAELYKYILYIQPEAGAQVLVGDNFIKHGDQKNAIKAYTKATEIDKWYADAFFKLGNVYYDSGKVPKAIDPYHQSVIRLPKEPFYNYQLGMAYLKTCKKGKKVDEAALNNSIKYLEFALKYQHDDKYLYFNLGNAYLEKGLFIHSKIDTLEKEIDKEKDTSKIKGKKQEIDKISPTGIYFYYKAINIYQTAIKHKVMDSETFYNLGNAFFKLGTLMEKQMEKYQNYGDELKLDAAWKKTHFLYNNSIKAYKLALKRKPKYADVYYDLGVVYYHKYNLKPDPNNIDIPPNEMKNYVAKGIAYYHTYMATQSIENFRQYLLLSPTAKNATYVKTLIDDIKIEAGLAQK